MRGTKPGNTTPTPSKERYLQILSTSNRKQADAELKKVKSKGFAATIRPSKDARNADVYRVWVGPYTEAKIDLAKVDLAAMGYKGVFIPQ